MPYHWLAKTTEPRVHTEISILDTIGSHYTVVSPHLKQELKPFGVERMKYIPNGTFNSKKQDPDLIRDKHDIPEGATVVFNIGSLTNQKRSVKFAKLMKHAAEKGDYIYVVIAGDGPLKEDIEIHTSEKIRVLGHISDNKKWK